MSFSGKSTSNMPQASWKEFASSLKGYVTQKDYKATYDALSSRLRGTREDGTKPTWDQWARQAFRPHAVSSTDTMKSVTGVEKLQLFPGWAVRRFKDPRRIHGDVSEFDLEVYVSGFASSLRPPEAATRSQKAFYHLAKGYAALPKLPTMPTQLGNSSPQQLAATSDSLKIPSDIDLSRLPPRPSEINEDTDLEALEAQFRRMNDSEHSSTSTHSDDEHSEIAIGNSNDTLKPCRNNTYEYPQDTQSISDTSSMAQSSVAQSSSSLASTLSLQENFADHVVRKLHANLDQRLKPFWSSAIPNRLVRLSLFCPSYTDAPSTAKDTLGAQEIDFEPLFVRNAITNNQGSFSVKILVPWERLTTHPPSLHIPFGDQEVEYPVVVQAEMWPPPPPPFDAPPSVDIPYMPYQREKTAHSTLHLSPHGSQTPSYPSDMQLVDGRYIPDNTNASTTITTRITVSLPVSHVPVRVISDIDDTIKYAGVLSGAKKVFRNVFTMHLEDLVIPSMVLWYKDMWRKGVRFHYVSNSPFELLPVLNEFFQLSSLPEGSLRLKSYAARTLLPALLSPPAARKRDGVVEVLDAFPESYFILIGDSGEQDMELYSELARERPHQIAGVFIRDVTTDPSREQLATGVEGGLDYSAANGSLNATYVDRLVDTEPQPIPGMLLSPHSNASTGTLSSSSSRELITPTSRPFLPRRTPSRKSSGGMTPEEKKRFELERRIQKARSEIPSHIAFRVFSDPDECMEVQHILERWTRRT